MLNLSREQTHKNVILLFFFTFIAQTKKPYHLLDVNNLRWESEFFTRQCSVRVVLHFKGKAWRRQLTFGYLFWGLKRKTRRTSVKIEEASCNTKYLVLFPGQKGLKLKSFRNNGLMPKILHFNRKIEKEHLCQKCNTSGLNSNFTSTEHGTISYSVFHSLRRLLSYFPLLL